jgi:hypothetical protein
MTPKQPEPIMMDTALSLWQSIKSNLEQMQERQSTSIKHLQEMQDVSLKRLQERQDDFRHQVMDSLVKLGREGDHASDRLDNIEKSLTLLSALDKENNNILKRINDLEISNNITTKILNRAVGYLSAAATFGTLFGLILKAFFDKFWVK